MKQTSSCAYMGNLAVVVHGEDNPTDAEWNQNLSELDAMPDAANLRVLIFTLGGGPTIEQRKKMNERFENVEVKMAVVSDTLRVRGVITAISWFNRGIKGFSSQHFDRAFDHLGLSHAERVRAATLVSKMMQLLGLARPESLARLAA